MKGILERATRCPDCGRPICSLCRSIVGSRCPYCGWKLETSYQTFIIAVAGGILFDGVLRLYDIHFRRGLGIGIGWGLMSVLLSTIIHFSPHKGRNLSGRGELKKKFTYSVGELYQKIFTTCQWEENVVIKFKDDENYSLCVEKKETQEQLKLILNETVDGFAEMRARLEGGRNPDYNRRQAELFGWICQRLGSDLK